MRAKFGCSQTVVSKKGVQGGREGVSGGGREGGREGGMDGRGRRYGGREGPAHVLTLTPICWWLANTVV